MQARFKTLLFIVLVVLLYKSTSGLAQEAPTIRNELVPGSVSDMANKLCAKFDLIRIKENGLHDLAVSSLRFTVMHHLDLSVSEEVDQKTIITFWNANHNQMVCTKEQMKWPYPQHLLKRIVSMDRNLKQNQPFFDYLFDNPEMSVNAVEIRDGKPETLIDYLNGILAAPVDPQRPWNLKEVEILRDDLREYLGAKTAAELSAEAVE